MSQPTALFLGTVEDKPYLPHTIKTLEKLCLSVPILLDEIDYQLYKDHTAYVLDTGYVIVYIGSEQCRLHKLILPDAEFVDHKDLNKLNNKRDNLRPCTKAENSRNRNAPSNNSSGYKGVYWNKKDKMWQAQIGYTENGKTHNIYLGQFYIKKSAAKAYNAAAIKIHGDFARLNDLEEE